MNVLWETHFRDRIEQLRRQDLHRVLKSVESGVGPSVRIAGREVLLFCSNDYLGLAADPRLKAAASRALEEWGTGSGASRLICGNSTLYGELEETLAGFKGTEAALVFSSGYATHMGVVPALAGPGDRIFSDALNHASIIDACRLSRAEVHVFPHRDVPSLERLLRERTGSGRALVITDGVFSMDGDLAPLPDLVRCCERFHALLLVDDAHGTGVLGERGRGTAEHFGVSSSHLLHMGTFSKALGGLGGFVAGSRDLVDYLINSARTLIYSTALPPATLAANRRAIELVDEDPNRRIALRQRAARLRSGLRALGYDVPDDPTPIVPLVVGSAKQALDLSAFLWEQGIFVPAIRPPTVPEGSSRLRISVTAAHTEGQVERLLHVVSAYGTARKASGLSGPETGEETSSPKEGNSRSPMETYPITERSACCNRRWA